MSLQPYLMQMQEYYSTYGPAPLQRYRLITPPQEEQKQPPPVIQPAAKLIKPARWYSFGFNPFGLEPRSSMSGGHAPTQAMRGFKATVVKPMFRGFFRYIDPATMPDFRRIPASYARSEYVNFLSSLIKEAEASNGGNALQLLNVINEFKERSPSWLNQEYGRQLNWLESTVKAKAINYYLNAFNSALRSGNINEAEAAASALRSLNPQLAREAYSELHKLELSRRVSSNINEVESLLKAGKYSEAEVKLKGLISRVTKANVDSSIVSRLEEMLRSIQEVNRYSELMSKYNEAVKVGDLNKALSILNEAAKYAPNNAALQEVQGLEARIKRIMEFNESVSKYNELIKQGKLQEALNALNEALTEAPNNEVAQQLQALKSRLINALNTQPQATHAPTQASPSQASSPNPQVSSLENQISNFQNLVTYLDMISHWGGMNYNFAYITATDLLNLANTYMPEYASSLQSIVNELKPHALSTGPAPSSIVNEIKSIASQMSSTAQSKVNSLRAKLHTLEEIASAQPAGSMNIGEPGAGQAIVYVTVYHGSPPYGTNNTVEVPITFKSRSDLENQLKEIYNYYKGQKGVTDVYLQVRYSGVSVGRNTISLGAVSMTEPFTINQASNIASLIWNAQPQVVYKSLNNFINTANNIINNIQNQLINESESAGGAITTGVAASVTQPGSPYGSWLGNMYQSLVSEGVNPQAAALLTTSAFLNSGGNVLNQVANEIANSLTSKATSELTKAYNELPPAAQEILTQRGFNLNTFLSNLKSSIGKATEEGVKAGAVNAYVNIFSNFTNTLNENINNALGSLMNTGNGIINAFNPPSPGTVPIQLRSQFNTLYQELVASGMPTSEAYTTALEALGLFKEPTLNQIESKLSNLQLEYGRLRGLLNIGEELGLVKPSELMKFTSSLKNYVRGVREYAASEYAAYAIPQLLSNAYAAGALNKPLPSIPSLLEASRVILNVNGLQIPLNEALKYYYNLGYLSNVNNLIKEAYTAGYQLGALNTVKTIPFSKALVNNPFLNIPTYEFNVSKPSITLPYTLPSQLTADLGLSYYVNEANAALNKAFMQGYAIGSASIASSLVNAAGIFINEANQYGAVGALNRFNASLSKANSLINVANAIIGNYNALNAAYGLGLPELKPINLNISESIQRQAQPQAPNPLSLTLPYALMIGGVSKPGGSPFTVFNTPNQVSGELYRELEGGFTPGGKYLKLTANGGLFTPIVNMLTNELPLARMQAESGIMLYTPVPVPKPTFINNGVTYWSQLNLTPNYSIEAYRALIKGESKLGGGINPFTMQVNVKAKPWWSSIEDAFNSIGNGIGSFFSNEKWWYNTTSLIVSGNAPNYLASLVAGAMFGKPVGELTYITLTSTEEQNKGLRLLKEVEGGEAAALMGVPYLFGWSIEPLLPLLPKLLPFLPSKYNYQGWVKGMEEAFIKNEPSISINVSNIPWWGRGALTMFTPLMITKENNPLTTRPEYILKLNPTDITAAGAFFAGFIAPAANALGYARAAEVLDYISRLDLFYDAINGALTAGRIGVGALGRGLYSLGTGLEAKLTGRVLEVTVPSGLFTGREIEELSSGLSSIVKAPVRIIEVEGANAIIPTAYGRFSEFDLMRAYEYLASNPKIQQLALMVNPVNIKLTAYTPEAYLKMPELIGRGSSGEFQLLTTATGGLQPTVLPGIIEVNVNRNIAEAGRLISGISGQVSELTPLGRVLYPVTYAQPLYNPIIRLGSLTVDISRIPVLRVFLGAGESFTVDFIAPALRRIGANLMAINEMGFLNYIQSMLGRSKAIIGGIIENPPVYEIKGISLLKVTPTLGEGKLIITPIEFLNLNANEAIGGVVIGSRAVGLYAPSELNKIVGYALIPLPPKGMEEATIAIPSVGRITPNVVYPAKELKVFIPGVGEVALTAPYLKSAESLSSEVNRIIEDFDSYMRSLTGSVAGVQRPLIGNPTLAEAYSLHQPTTGIKAIWSSLEGVFTPAPTHPELAFTRLTTYDFLNYLNRALSSSILPELTTGRITSVRGLEAAAAAVTSEVSGRLGLPSTTAAGQFANIYALHGFTFTDFDEFINSLNKWSLNSFSSRVNALLKAAELSSVNNPQLTYILRNFGATPSALLTTIGRLTGSTPLIPLQGLNPRQFTVISGLKPLAGESIEEAYRSITGGLLPPTTAEELRRITGALSVLGIGVNPLTRFGELAEAISESAARGTLSGRLLALQYVNEAGRVRELLPLTYSMYPRLVSQVMNPLLEEFSVRLREPAVNFIRDMSMLTPLINQPASVNEAGELTISGVNALRRISRLLNLDLFNEANAGYGSLLRSISDYLSNVKAGEANAGIWLYTGRLIKPTGEATPFYVTYTAGTYTIGIINGPTLARVIETPGGPITMLNTRFFTKGAPPGFIGGGFALTEEDIGEIINRINEEAAAGQGTVVKATKGLTTGVKATGAAASMESTGVKATEATAGQAATEVEITGRLQLTQPEALMRIFSEPALAVESSRLTTNAAEAAAKVIESAGRMINEASPVVTMQNIGVNAVNAPNSERKVEVKVKPTVELINPNMQWSMQWMPLNFRSIIINPPMLNIEERINESIRSSTRRWFNNLTTLFNINTGRGINEINIKGIHISSIKPLSIQNIKPQGVSSIKPLAVQIQVPKVTLKAPTITITPLIVKPIVTTPVNIPPPPSITVSGNLQTGSKPIPQIATTPLAAPPYLSKRIQWANKAFNAVGAKGAELFKPWF